jgi:hypothetical protein
LDWLTSLFKCIDYLEIQDWLNDNKEQMAAHFGCVPPSSYLCLSDFRKIDDLSWTFYLFTPDKNCLDFINHLENLSFSVVWTFSTDRGIDCSISMLKKDWAIMWVYEILCS